MTNPNVYPKGSVYHNYAEAGPVMDAVVAYGYHHEGVEWYVDSRGTAAFWLPEYDAFPINISFNIPIPQPEAPKPLTVEEMRQRWACGDVNAWYDMNGTPLEEDITYGLTLNIPCYATEEDCKSAHDLGVV